MNHRLFKVLVSRGAEVVLDERIEAASPREARSKMKEKLGVPSLSGVVYSLTEIPAELLRSLVVEELSKVTLPQRVAQGRGKPAVDVKKLVAAAVREQIARSMDELASRMETVEQRIEQGSALHGKAQSGPKRVDVLSKPSPAPQKPTDKRNTGTPAAKNRAQQREIPEPLRAILGPDWTAIRAQYESTRSVKQTAAEFDVSINTLKARIRREGWGK
jgi:hypothetical protein